jgi:hypothetical protein
MTSFLPGPLWTGQGMANPLATGMGCVRRNSFREARDRDDLGCD